MTREDIIKLARETGLADSNGVVHAFYQLERFAALVAAVEREACAQVVEAIDRNGAWVTKAEAAAAIRARSKP